MCLLTLLSCVCGTSVSRGSSTSCVWPGSGPAGRLLASLRSGPVYHTERARWSSSTSTHHRSRCYWLKRENKTHWFRYGVKEEEHKVFLPAWLNIFKHGDTKEKKSETVKNQHGGGFLISGAGLHTGHSGREQSADPAKMVHYNQRVFVLRRCEYRSNWLLKIRTVFHLDFAFCFCKLEKWLKTPSTKSFNSSVYLVPVSFSLDS